MLHLGYWTQLRILSINFGMELFLAEREKEQRRYNSTAKGCDFSAIFISPVTVGHKLHHPNKPLP